MSFVISELHEIISVVSDIVFMGDSESQISIQTGVESVNYGDELEQIEKRDESFFQVSCPLKNGQMDIKIWDEAGKISYTVSEAIKPITIIDFDDQDVGERAGSFHLALKEILKTDRQSKKISDFTPVDRASFGLVSN
jgi:hypothetical protein